MDFNIFFEKKFIYRRGAEKPRTSERTPQKKGAETFSEKMDAISEKLKAIHSHVNERIAKLKGKRMRRSVRQKIKKLKEKLWDLEQKAIKLEAMRKDKRKKVMEKVNKALDKIIKKEGIVLPEKKPQAAPGNAPGKAPAKAPGKAPKGAPTKKAGPSESKIGPREYSKMNKRQEALIFNLSRNMVQNFSKLRELGYLRSDIRDALESQIDSLVRILGRNPKNISDSLQHHEYYKLPGGYTIALYKWKKNGKSKPNAMIYKGTELVLYQQDGGLQAPEGDKYIDKGRQYAEMVKCFHLLPQTFYVEKGKLVIKNGKENEFHKLLGDITKFSGKFKWNVRIHGCALGYDPKQKGLIITPYNTDFKFIIRPPSRKMQFERGSEDKYVQYETSDQEKQRSVRLQQEANEQKDKAELKQKLAAEIYRGKAKLDRRINAKKYKSIVKRDINPKNPYEFKFVAKDKKAEKLIRKTNLSKLLNLKTCKEVVYVTITDKAGKKREGMFYPGQKACYELKNGKQTTKRLTFSKDETAKLAFAEVSQEHYKKLNPSLKRRISKPKKAKSKLDDFKRLPTLAEFRQRKADKLKAKKDRLAKSKEQNEQNKKDMVKMKKLLGSTYSKFSLNRGNPTEFKVSSRGLAKLKMKNFFAGLKNIKDEIVRVTLTDKRGMKRTGEYRPGQATLAVYLIENGKQTNKEMKFYRNETFKIDFIKTK